MYGFCAKQSKSQKTNRSNWPICFVFSVKSHSSSVWVPAVCRTENENTSKETQIRTDIRYGRKTRSHTSTEHGVWWMMFGLGRLHFIREEDKLCAKLSALFILSGLWRASGDSGKQCKCQQGGGITHPWLGQTLSHSLFTVLYVVHMGPWKLAGQHWNDGLPIRTGSQAESHVSSCVLCLLLDTVWSRLSADLPQAAVLQIHWVCTRNVWLISHVEDYVDY